MTITYVHVNFQDV